MKYVVWTLIALLIVLHQDVWFWDDRRLVFGFLPVSLAYHMALSLAAAAVWYLATIFAWPVRDEEEAALIAKGNNRKHGDSGSGAAK
jgi:hypothetical protein